MLKSRKVFYQFIACSPVVLTHFLVGVGWGWISPTLKKLQSNDSDSEFRITANDAAWLGSINEAGRIFGPFISPFLLDNIGRRNTLNLTIVMHISIWFVAIFARNVYIICTVRIFFGITNGINDVLYTVYVTENCSPNFRGVIVSLMQLAFNIGLIFESIVTTYSSYTNAAIINTVVSACTFSSLYFGMETPYFLTMKGKSEEAKRNLMRLRIGVDENKIANELESIRKNVEDEKAKKQSFKSLFASPDNMKSIFIVVGIFLLSGLSGFHAVIPYSSMIFSPSETFTSNEYTILFGVLQFTGTLISPFVIERWNRRILIITANSLLTCSVFGTCVLLYLHSRNYEVFYYPWLLFLSIGMYGVLGVVAASAVCAVTGEILPLSVRAIGGSMAVSIQSLVSFGTALSFWSITNHFGMGTNFFIYTMANLLTTLFICTVLPETKGKALHEMHKKTTISEHL